MSGACPFGEESALAVGVEQSLLYLSVYRWVDKVQQREERTERVPEPCVGVHVPRQHLAVVGAVVLGDTAVKAGLLSSPAVLVAALSGIGLYCVPDSIGTFSVLRILCVGLGGVLGLYGIAIGIIAIIAYLVGFDSYGTPYLAPYAPMIGNDLQDGLFKRSNLSMKERPKSIPNVNRTRMKGEEK